MTFPTRLRATRRAWHLTIKQLAACAGLSYAAICDYENGKTDPRTFALCCLADALGVSTDYLLGGCDDV